MRLPMFDIMDATTALLERRREFYQSCAYDLQELISSTLSGDALLSVSVRVKKSLSLREKMLRKRLYLEFDNPYDLLNNLSDLIGLRAECRFLREESHLFQDLCDACTLRHADGAFSVPSHPNIRFNLTALQPQIQQNGLNIYRVDGRYHKNGVSAPFELQIKALVHVFWAEVEHQLIYKNNSYMLMDSFLKKLLYSNYDSLQQIDQHLQLIYDQMQSTPTKPENVRYTSFRPILAKILSDIYMRQMQGQMGFSVRLDATCDILTQYILSRGDESGNPMSELIENLRNAASKPIEFENSLELEGAFYSDDLFLSTMGCHLAQQLNTSYDWNLFFRLLFSLEEGCKLDIFSSFISSYRDNFTSDSLYESLEASERAPAREAVLTHLASALVQYGNVTMFDEAMIHRLRRGIERICAIGCHKEPERIKLVLNAALE